MKRPREILNFFTTGTMVASYFSDRYKVRGVQFVIFGVISMIGYIIALVVNKEQNKLYVLFVQP